MTKHLDLARLARLDPEGRALSACIAEQRPEDELNGLRTLLHAEVRLDAAVAGVAERINAQRVVIARAMRA